MSTGLAVITYNRPLYLRQCIEALESCSWGGATERIVVIDELPKDSYFSIVEEYGRRSGQPPITFYYQPNSGVASAKNTAFKALLALGCEHIFIIEDDILMQDPQTCEKYITYAHENGLQHLNFGLHGPMNVGQAIVIDGITCYPDCVGAFSYYTREVLEVVGLMDEEFKNAWEHVEHTLRIARLGYTTPFWLFADHPQGGEMLREIPGSIIKSSIRPRADWEQNIKNGMRHWVKKHGSFLPQKPNYNELLGKSYAEVLRIMQKA